jgi:hypothetical protein
VELIPVDWHSKPALDSERRLAHERQAALSKHVQRSSRCTSRCRARVYHERTSSSIGGRAGCLDTKKCAKFERLAETRNHPKGDDLLANRDFRTLAFFGSVVGLCARPVALPPSITGKDERGSTLVMSCCVSLLRVVSWLVGMRLGVDSE